MSRLHLIGGQAFPLPANDDRPYLYAPIPANDHCDPDAAFARAALDFIRENLVAFLCGVWVGVAGLALPAILLVSR
jgi:hypothetical protein